MQRLNQYLHACLVMAGIVFLVTLTLFTVRIGRQISAVLTETQETSTAIKLVSQNAKDFIAKQKEELEDPYHVKLRDAALQVGPAFVSVARSLNTQTLPAAKSAIQSLEASSGQLQTLIANSDAQINQNVLPETTKAIAGIGSATNVASDAVKSLQSASEATLKATEKTINSLQDRINDPNITTAVQEFAASATQIRKSTENLAFATVSIKDTLSEFPGMAKDVHAFTNAQSKATKWIIGSRIIGGLIPILNALPR